MFKVSFLFTVHNPPLFIYEFVDSIVELHSVVGDEGVKLTTIQDQIKITELTEQTLTRMNFATTRLLSLEEAQDIWMGSEREEEMSDERVIRISNYS